MRHNISFPIRVSWKDENGREITQEGLTENADDEVTFPALVICVERNAAHPQVAFQLTESLRLWRKKVWELAGERLTAEKPEEWEDWN